MRGQTKDRVGGERTGQLACGEDSGVQLLGGLVVGNQDEAWCVGGAHKERKIQRARGEGESRHTSTPRATAQVAAHTLEGHRILKVRKHFADERQNHCWV